MSDALAAKLQALRQLVAATPDRALERLETLLGESEVGAMAEVRRLVEGERLDRRLRDEVFAPVLPLFSARADGIPAPRFAPTTLGVLWRALKCVEPQSIMEFEQELDDRRPQATAIADVLCHRAAAFLREPDVRAEARIDPETAENLSAFLELAHLGRAVVQRMPDWVSRMSDERAASLKLLLRDAAQISPDGAPRLFEIALARLPQAPMILRLVALVTDRATDRFLAASEMASFGARLLDDLETRIDRVARLDLSGGAAAAEAAARDVLAAYATLEEFNARVELCNDGPWGQKLAAARKRLAQLVEERLRDLEGALNQAIPMQTVRISGRMTRPAPKLVNDPDPAMVERARALAVLLRDLRPAAAIGGYGALRNQIVDKLTERLDTYAEEVLHLINAGECVNEVRARIYLELAAELLSYVKDEQAAQIVRRRAAVAGAKPPSQDVA